MSNEPVQWNPSFETGIQIIDEEHARLLLILNSLIEMLDAGAPIKTWLPELDRLIEEVVAHFTHEERVMENVGYPGFLAHRQQHQRLVQEVADFRSQLSENNGNAETLATVRFLKFWVLKHMVQEDSKIKQYVYRGLLDEH